MFSLSFQYLTNTVELDLSYFFGAVPKQGDIHCLISDEMKVTAGMIIFIQF